MRKLAIGKPGDTWKPEYEAQLLVAIKSLYGGHFPYTYSPGEVVDELGRYYATDRSDNALYEEIKYLLNKEGGVFKTIDISKDKKTVLVQEYSDTKHLEKRLFTGKVSEQDRVKSEISISQRGNRILYIFPSVLDADYGIIFSTIFRVSFSANEIFQNDVKKMYNVNEKKWIRIPIKGLGVKQFDKLSTAVWFLLDLLFSKLTEDLANSLRSKGTKSQQAERDKKRDEIMRLLDFFEYYGYSFSQKKKLVKLINTKSIPLESCNLSLLDKIKRGSNNVSLTIPVYAISMSQMFELYVYSYLSLINPDITIEYKPKYKKKVPDMYFSDGELDACIIDAKYKFQYGRDGKYCEIDDANRMFNYLVYLEQEQTGCNARGLFCYPTLKNEKRVFFSDLLKKKRIAKISITLPVNRAFNLHKF